MKLANNENFIQSLLDKLGRYIDDLLCQDLERVFPEWVKENGLNFFIL